MTISQETALPERRAILIAGPTASGKSALAYRVAERTGGVLVNTDAMQVYDVLEVLTARPSAGELAPYDHRLFGTVHPGERYSTGKWLSDVTTILAETPIIQPLIFVGGTGLYFDALTKGFADIPQIPPEIAEAARYEVAGLDEAGRMLALEEADPVFARKLGVVDPQRLERALSVKRATGRALSSFQADLQPPLLGGAIKRIVLDPDRDIVRERIASRFGQMFNSGAVAEVEALLALDLDPLLPAMKAIGVPEIAAWLNGEVSQEVAIERSIIATRQYAKRQGTWFRNRMGDWPRPEGRDPLEALDLDEP